MGGRQDAGKESKPIGHGKIDKKKLREKGEVQKTNPWSKKKRSGSFSVGLGACQEFALGQVFSRTD